MISSMLTMLSLLVETLSIVGGAPPVISWFINPINYRYNLFLPIQDHVGLANVGSHQVPSSSSEVPTQHYRYPIVSLAPVRARSLA